MNWRKVSNSGCAITGSFTSNRLLLHAKGCDDYRHAYDVVIPPLSADR